MFVSRELSLTGPPDVLVSFIRKTGFGGPLKIRAFVYDAPLLSSLVERRRSETNTFHLSWNECTITLNDHTRVATLRDLKQLILSNFGVEGGREISNLAYRFQAMSAENKLECRPSWISEDKHIWINFETFLSVCSTDGPLPINVAAPDDLAMGDYNSGNDFDYEEESSCHSTEEDEDVTNTSSVGDPRLVLPTPLPIPYLDEQLDLDTRHVKDPSMECVAVEYNTDGELSSWWGTECKIDRQYSFQ
ncbi:hypothetical protein PIB30_011410 [Stylosanthes scabra]|uniref:Aminotransferase-like plant mobile domain-containing protein n=1 Tax=Stylosanthes scabra TaxID=79078 RepID=A0ABU6Z3H7_9FABA|nr:hypothetical protein [Stylosanthes scabra]